MRNLSSECVSGLLLVASGCGENCDLTRSYSTRSWRCYAIPRPYALSPAPQRSNAFSLIGRKRQSYAILRDLTRSYAILRAVTRCVPPICLVPPQLRGPGVGKGLTTPSRYSCIKNEVSWGRKTKITVSLLNPYELYITMFNEEKESSAIARNEQYKLSPTTTRRTRLCIFTDRKNVQRLQ